MIFEISSLCQPTDNVIAYYPFNGNANDVTANKKNGVIYNVTSSSDRLGKANAAYTFNGTNSKIILPNTLFTSNSAFAISLWFRFSGVILRPADYGSEQLIDLRGQYNFNVAYVRNNHPTNPKSVMFNLASSSSSINCFSANSSIQDATWYHIVACYSNNTMKLYLNGNLVDTKTNTPPSIVSGYSNALGKDYNMSKDRCWFNGILDEVILYKRSLTSTEALALYTRGLTSSDFTELFAPQSIKYSYDVSGNRTNRTIVISKSANVFTETDSTGFNFFDINNSGDKFEDDLGDKKVIILPNPTKGKLLVEIHGYNQEMSSALYLYNLAGKLLINKTHANSTMTLDLTSYPTGIYILKIKLGDKVSEWKIIKE